MFVLLVVWVLWQINLLLLRVFRLLSLFLLLFSQTLNDKNQQTSSQKFRQLRSTFEGYLMPNPFLNK